MDFTFSNIFTTAFIGVLIYQCILSGFQYSLNKQKEYLYYTAYLFMLVINFIINFYFWLKPGGSSYAYLVTKQILGLPINFFIQIIYLYFLLYYLQISTTGSVFNKQIKQQIFINLLLGTGLTLYCFYHPLWGYVLNEVVLLLSFVLYTYLYILLTKTKPANYKFIVQGTIFLISGFVLNVLLAIFDLNLFYNDITIMAGVLIEIGFFNYGLQYKMKNQEKALLLAEIEKQKAIENEHRRVSADLHDEVGSALSSIQIMSVISRKKLDTDVAETKLLLQKITGQAQKMQHNLSDIVWGLRTDLDSVEDMTLKMQEILTHTLEPAQINYSIEMNDAVQSLKLSVLQRRNLLLFFKEAINNILKYAGTASVSIKIRKESGCLNIQIIDYGKGFKYPNQNVLGNGLLNMEKRIRQLDGVFFLESVLKKGTTVGCSLPVSN